MSCNVLPFLSFLDIYPPSSSLPKYECTVAVDFRPTAFPISLTDGGYPFSFNSVSMNFRMSFFPFI